MDVIVSEFVERFVYVEINVYLQLIKVVSKSLSSISHYDNLVYVEFTVTYMVLVTRQNSDLIQTSV